MIMPLAHLLIVAKLIERAYKSRPKSVDEPFGEGTSLYMGNLRRLSSSAAYTLEKTALLDNDRKCFGSR